MRCLLLILTAASLFAADIPSGSHVLLRMQNSINSRTSKPGDFVYLQTATPVAAGGSILIPIGSYVQGIVVEANRGGRVKGRANLTIRLEKLTLATGQEYKFEPRVASLEGDGGGQKITGNEGKIQQGSDVGRDVGQVAILAGTGSMIGALATRTGSAGNIARGVGIGGGAGGVVGLASTLLTRGRDVDLRQGASLDVVFDRAIALE